ncbi:MAG: hypothetical protein M3475_09015 [Actinomycetota bacterium]|nr:hypothetical protein [Actinomycetota bacterium]
MEYGGGGVPERQGHSKLGISSVIIAVLATFVIVILFIVAGSVASTLFESQDPAAIDPQSLQSSPEATTLAIVGIGILGSFLLYLLGLILGVAGIFQGRKKRLFGILGAVLNGLVLLAVVLLFVIGTIIGGAAGA